MPQPPLDEIKEKSKQKLLAMPKSTFQDWKQCWHECIISEGVTLKKLKIMVIFLSHLVDIAHTSMLVREFLAKNKTLIIPQQPYSQDLAPAGFSIFPKLKTRIKGKI